MGALTIKLSESLLAGRVPARAEQEAISTGQLAVLAVAEKVARPSGAAAPHAYLHVVEQLGEDLASACGRSLAEAARSVFDTAMINFYDQL